MLYASFFSSRINWKFIIDRNQTIRAGFSQELLMWPREGASPGIDFCPPGSYYVCRINGKGMKLISYMGFYFYTHASRHALNSVEDLSAGYPANILNMQCHRVDE